jgi:uncharacterized protein YndB with AHSA1/START domain
MTAYATPDAFGVLTQPATLKIQRLLPGPIERVWAYITDGELRKQWMAAGEMRQSVGAPVEFVWRNDDLTKPPGTRPAGFPEEHRMTSRITAIDAPRKLGITWGESGEVTFELEDRPDGVLLTVTHQRLGDRSMKLMVSAGWHAHLDILAARLAGTPATSFWDGWSRLRAEYEHRIPA